MSSIRIALLSLTDFLCMTPSRTTNITQPVNQPNNQSHHKTPRPIPSASTCKNVGRRLTPTSPFKKEKKNGERKIVFRSTPAHSSARANVSLWGHRHQPSSQTAADNNHKYGLEESNMAGSDRWVPFGTAVKSRRDVVLYTCALAVPSSSPLLTKAARLGVCHSPRQGRGRQAATTASGIGRAEMQRGPAWTCWIWIS